MNTADPGIAPTTVSTFSYEAQTSDGQRLSGTIEALDAEVAMERLSALRLRVVRVAPAALASGRPLRAREFLAFNQQLAELTAAGLPVEQGLRLIAADIRGKRLNRTLDELAAELESGTPLDQAFEKFRTRFPPLYGQLIRAGIKSGNLSAVLLGLGKHLEMVQRLRSALWRATSYPLVVLLGLGLVLTVLGIWVLPQMASGFAGFKFPTPWITQVLLDVSQATPWILGGALVLVAFAPLLWGVLRATGRWQRFSETAALSLPLIGPVLRANLTARWCDAARIAIDAGLDLPSAMELASDAVGSPRLRSDGQALSAALATGKPLTAAHTRLIPPTVPTAIQFASAFHDLPTTLRSLTDLYERQAEIRLATIPAILTPLLLIVIACSIGFVIFGILAPLMQILEALGRSWR